MPFGGSSPLFSAYAESFVTLSFKINFAYMSVCEFAKLNFQLREQAIGLPFQWELPISSDAVSPDRWSQN